MRVFRQSRLPENQHFPAGTKHDDSDYVFNNVRLPPSPRLKSSATVLLFFPFLCLLCSIFSILSNNLFDLYDN